MTKYMKRFYGTFKGSFDIVADDEEDLYEQLSQIEAIDGVAVSLIDITDQEKEPYWDEEAAEERRHGI